MAKARSDSTGISASSEFTSFAFRYVELRQRFGVEFRPRTARSTSCMNTSRQQWAGRTRICTVSRSRSASWRSLLLAENFEEMHYQDSQPPSERGSAKSGESLRFDYEYDSATAGDTTFSLRAACVPRREFATRCALKAAGLSARRCRWSQRYGDYLKTLSDPITRSGGNERLAWPYHPEEFDAKAAQERCRRLAGLEE